MPLQSNTVHCAADSLVKQLQLVKARPCACVLPANHRESHPTHPGYQLQRLDAFSKPCTQIRDSSSNCGHRCAGGATEPPAPSSFAVTSSALRARWLNGRKHTGNVVDSGVARRDTYQPRSHSRKTYQNSSIGLIIRRWFSHF